jgi:hypothetical protein
MCRWHATYRWKDLEDGYNFASNLILIGGLKKKLWASKVAKVPISRILGLHEQNDIWVLASWLGKKNTIRGKVVAPLKSRLW